MTAAISLRLDVRGVVGIRRMFERVERRDGRKAVRKALRAGIHLVTKKAKAIAPVGSKSEGDEDPGALRKAIRTRAGKRSRRYIAMVAILGKEFFQGDSFYGGPQEFGWKAGRRRKSIPGKHFMEAAGELTERHVQAKVIRVLTTELERALI